MNFSIRIRRSQDERTTKIVVPATSASTPETMPGSSLGLDSGVEARATGEFSVSVAADEISAVASGNRISDAIAAAAAATLGTLAAHGFTF